MSAVRLKALRRGVPAEVRALVRFINKNYVSAVPLTAHAVKSGAVRFFWAHDAVSKERVGVCAYVKKTPWLAETVKTVVDPRHRGSGYGVSISAAIEEQCRRDGFHKVMTTIYSGNRAMLAIKKRQGYRVEGYHRDHERPGWHEYSLGKVLSRRKSS